MDTIDLLRAVFKEKRGHAEIHDIYAYGLAKKGDWEQYDSDYQHRIRNKLQYLTEKGNLRREGRGVYRVIEEF